MIFLFSLCLWLCLSPPRCTCICTDARPHAHRAHLFSLHHIQGYRRNPGRRRKPQTQCLILWKQPDLCLTSIEVNVCAWEGNCHFHANHWPFSHLPPALSFPTRLWLAGGELAAPPAPLLPFIRCSLNMELGMPWSPPPAFS